MKMKRNLIALAVGSAASIAMVAPAMAETTVYGHAQVELASVSYQTEAGPGTCDADNADVGDVCDGIDMLDNARGRIGVKASEDLGNGWTGIAKFEYKADTSGSGGLSDRDTMVGLKGSGIQIEAGRLKSAYKYTGGVKYDAFVTTTLQARGNGGMSGNGAYGPMGAEGAYGHNSFLSDHIGIKGGSGPVTGWLTFGPKDGDGSYSLGVMFKQDAFEAFVAAIDAGDRENNGELLTGTETTIDDYTSLRNEYSAVKVGGAFKAGPHKVMFQYEMTEQTFDASGIGGSATFTIEPEYMFIGYNMKMGKNTFVAQFGTVDTDDAGFDTDYLALGVIHKFTKMTRIFGGFRSSDSEADHKEDVVTVGLRKDF